MHLLETEQRILVKFSQLSLDGQRLPYKSAISDNSIKQMLVGMLKTEN